MILKLKHLLGSTSKNSNSCTCYKEEEGLHAIFRVEEESSQSSDNGRVLLMMIDNNAHPSCQLVHQQFLVSTVDLQLQFCYH